MHTTINSTDIEHLESARESIRATIESVTSQMLDCSARLRDLREAERDLTIRLINAHSTPAPSVPSVPSVPSIP